MLGLGAWSWANPGLIHLVWGAVAITLVLGWLELRSRTALGRFVSSVMQTRLAHGVPLERRIARVGLVFLTLLLGVLAVMRPQSEGTMETIRAARMSADIMVVLDVSRSMLAEDAAPTRLERAKSEVAAMVQRLPGHRVGLVAFAGRATLLAPLTADQGFFNMILRGTDTRSVSRGGTRIGEALRVAVNSFGETTSSKLILLITDGEDHDSFPLEAAKKAKAKGIRVISIGFGSEDGTPITLVDPDTKARSKLTDKQGNVVMSKLDGALLRKIALETEGAYIPAGVAALDLESIVKSHVVPMVREAGAERVKRIPRELFPWFVLGSLVCLFGAVWLGGIGSSKEIL